MSDQEIFILFLFLSSTPSPSIFLQMKYSEGCLHWFDDYFIK